MLHRVSSEQRIQLYRLMPQSCVFEPLVHKMIGEAAELKSLIPIYGELLQYTDDFNFSILTSIQSLATDDLIREIVISKEKELLIGLVRMIDAIPYVC